MWLHCVQVLLELTRQAQQEKTVLSLSVCQLGAEGKKRSFDLSVTSYLRRVSLDYCDVPGKSEGFGSFPSAPANQKQTFTCQVV